MKEAAVPVPMPLIPLALVGVVTVAAAVWASVDASSRPPEAWQRAGQSRTLWMALPVAALLVSVPGLALVVAVVYAMTVRTQLVPAGS
jgi:hypothetical protein